MKPTLDYLDERIEISLQNKPKWVQGRPSEAGRNNACNATLLMPLHSKTPIQNQTKTPIKPMPNMLKSVSSKLFILLIPKLQLFVNVVDDYNYVTFQLIIHSNHCAGQ